jgi:hypothetical protein
VQAHIIIQKKKKKRKSSSYVFCLYIFSYIIAKRENSCQKEEEKIKQKEKSQLEFKFAKFSTAPARRQL